MNRIDALEYLALHLKTWSGDVIPPHWEFGHDSVHGYCFSSYKDHQAKVILKSDWEAVRWIPHTGQLMPVDTDTLVDFRMSCNRDNGIFRSDIADSLRWDSSRLGKVGDTDITHYRIAQAPVGDGIADDTAAVAAAFPAPAINPVRYSPPQPLTLKANHSSYSQLIDQGWTDATLVSEGLMEAPEWPVVGSETDKGTVLALSGHYAWILYKNYLTPVSESISDLKQPDPCEKLASYIMGAAIEDMEEDEMERHIAQCLRDLAADGKLVIT